MAVAQLSIDLTAVAQNWRALAAKSQGETAAVVKADAYGLGVAPVGRALAAAGVRSFFVAAAEEGVALRSAIDDAARIFVFSGHMDGDKNTIAAAGLIPLVNSADQLLRQLEALPGHPFGVQLDTGMNRLGMEPEEWASLRDIALGQSPQLIMSHLACADEPDHPMNAQQLNAFRTMTDGISAPRSLAATGGVLLGADYHFDLTRPGVGLYGGAPYMDARPVVELDIPIIQTRLVRAGETVGYGNSWTAKRDSLIATIAAGYADGLHRVMGPKTQLYADGVSCPVVGRISMDMIAVDVTDLTAVPDQLQILNADQGVDDLAANAGTIGYEILTSLGQRYGRSYVGGQA